MDFLESLKTKFLEERNYNKAISAGFKPLDKKQYNNYNKFRPNGPKQIFCYLPYNSLTFSFGGSVYVCSYNRDISLGKYPQNSIKEIWEGEKAKKLREHMSHNDLEYGCRHCKFFFDKGKFSNIRPLVFDKYYEHTNADYPRVFEFEIDNKCNLECQMCRGEVSSSIRKNRDKLPPLKTPYDDNFVKQLEEYIPTLKEAKFYGGEPFMIPIYRKIWKSVKELNPKLDMFAITNGSLWNNEIETLINELNFDIAISIDALDKEILEKIRKNVHKETLIENIHRFNEVCLRKKRNLSLSFTIQKDNWTQLPKHIEFCNSIDAYAYISYLENPKEFSILELPKKEIEDIRNWMENFSFPSSNNKEKYNKRCFEDYKNYLDAYLKNINEPRYDDYEFIPEWAKDEGKKIFYKENHIIVQSNASKELLLETYNEYIKNHKIPEKYSPDELLKKLDRIIIRFTAEEQKKIYGMILKSDVINTFESLYTRSEEDLYITTKNNLSLIIIEEE
jgi:radical SAM protein with 4Fe4S-binding SPASM domain